MKKLLTILALAALLCTLCGIAMAEETYPTPADLASATKILVDGVERDIVTSLLPGAIAKAQSEQHVKGMTETFIKVRVPYEDKDKNVAYKDVYMNPHDLLGDKAVTKAATCFTKGSYTAACSVCGYKTSGTIKAGEKLTVPGTGAAPAFTALGHAHVQKVKTEASCTAEGQSATYCPICNEFKSGSEVVTEPTKVHVYTKAIETKDYTCSQNGSYYWACINCDKPDPARGAVAVTTLAEYKKLLNGTSAALTSGCIYVQLGSHDPANYDGHNWNKWSLETPATCLRRNVYVRWCKNGCETTQEDDQFIANPNNAYAKPVWILDPDSTVHCSVDSVKFICKNCKGASPDTTHATYTANNEVVDGKKAGYAFDPNGVKVILPHEYDLKSENCVKDGANDKVFGPYCTEGAYKAYYCVHETTKTEAGHAHNLKKVYIDDKPALGHKWGAWTKSNAVDENGKPYYYRQCERCFDVQRVFDGIPTDMCTAHEFEVTTEPTCTEAGEKTCKKCGTTEEVAALGHDYKTIVEEAATCTKEGKGTKVCNRCNDVVKDAVIVKLPHTPGEPEVTPATTEKEGSKVVKCTVCGEVLSTEVLPKELGETEFTAEVKFGEMTLTGKADQKEGTKEAKAVYARVTYFMADGTYVVVSVPVEADGTFESMNSGNVIHVSVQIVDSAKVRPGEFNRFGGAEFDVK